MEHRCCGIDCIFNNSSNKWALVINCNDSAQLCYTAGIYCFHGKLTSVEICTEVSFTSPEAMWTLIRKLPYTKVKFYPELKSQTGLSSLRVSRKRALNVYVHWKKLKLETIHGRIHRNKIKKRWRVDDSYLFQSLYSRKVARRTSSMIQILISNFAILTLF